MNNGRQGRRRQKAGGREAQTKMFKMRKAVGKAKLNQQLHNVDTPVWWRLREECKGLHIQLRPRAKAAKQAAEFGDYGHEFSAGDLDLAYRKVGLYPIDTFQYSSTTLYQFI
jgi:hypothetical protein